MTDAETILKMIETVDPLDKLTLKEIDSRVWCFLKGYSPVKIYNSLSRDAAKEKFSGMKNAEKENYNLVDLGHDNYDPFFGTPDEFAKSIYPYAEIEGNRWVIVRVGCHGYTRSRDELKKIRPKDLDDFYIQSHEGRNDWLSANWICWLNSGSDYQQEFRGDGATEELAELHAYIQAIDHERRSSKNHPNN